MSIISIPGWAENGIEVADDEVDRVDAVGVEIGQVLGIVAVGEDAAVDTGVQRHDAVTQHDRRAGVVGDVDHRHAGFGDGPGGAARRHQLPAEVVQALGEVDDAGLVVHGQQGSHDGDSSWPMGTAAGRPSWSGWSRSAATPPASMTDRRVAG